MTNDVAKIKKFLKAQRKELVEGYEDIYESEDESEIASYEAFGEVLDFIEQHIEIKKVKK
jgi:hypothetical protein